MLDSEVVFVVKIGKFKGKMKVVMLKGKGKLCFVSLC